jgi:hypothetical protein
MTSTPYRIVNHNQDTLLINFKFANEDGTPNGATLPERVSEQLDEWQSLARKEHTPQPTGLTFSYLTGSDRYEQTLFIRPHGSGIWSWLLFCDDLTLSMAYGSLNGGTYARARFSSHLLHTIGAEQAMTRVEAMLYALLQEHFHKQVSEIHLCADIIGWDLSSIDWHHDFISRVVLIRERPELPEENEQEGGLSSSEVKKLEDTIKEQINEFPHLAFPTTEHRKIATLDFGTHGSQISAQIYNKSREIKKHKKPWFLPIWEANGYNPETDGEVVRLEFRIKRKWLADYELNDPAEIFTRLEQIWRYCTEEWLRYVDSSATTANITRRPTREVWTVFQNAYTVLSSQVTRSLQGEQQARIADLIARDPLSAVQNASNLQLQEQLMDAPSLPAPALRPIYLTCRNVLYPLFSCYFIHWLAEESARLIHVRLMHDRDAIAATLSTLPHDELLDLARQEYASLSPELLAFSLSLHSPASFRTVQTSLVKRTRRMAKKEACIAAIAGYIRSAVVQAGDELSTGVPDFPTTMQWVGSEVQRYNASKNRVHLFEVLKKQLAEGIITAEHLFEEMARHGVELEACDEKKVADYLLSLRRSSKPRKNRRSTPITDEMLSA